MWPRDHYAGIMSVEALTRCKWRFSKVLQRFPNARQTRPGETPSRLRDRLQTIHKSFQDNRLRESSSLTIVLEDAPGICPGSRAKPCASSSDALPLPLCTIGKSSVPDPEVGALGPRRGLGLPFRSKTRVGVSDRSMQAVYLCAGTYTWGYQAPLLHDQVEAARGFGDEDRCAVLVARAAKPA
jgi:hypothetical protein